MTSRFQTEQRVNGGPVMGFPGRRREPFGTGYIWVCEWHREQVSSSGHPLKPPGPPLAPAKPPSAEAPGTGCGSQQAEQPAGVPHPGRAAERPGSPPPHTKAKAPASEPLNGDLRRGNLVSSLKGSSPQARVHVTNNFKALKGTFNPIVCVGQSMGQPLLPSPPSCRLSL